MMSVIVMSSLEIIYNAYPLLRKLYLIQSSVLRRKCEDRIVVYCYNFPRFEVQKDMGDYSA